MAEPLTARAAVTAPAAPRGVRLREIPDVGKIDLRGDPLDRAFLSAVGRTLDLILPTEPCSSARQGSTSALWLGPDHWLITCPRADARALVGGLREALGIAHAAVTDVGAGRTIIRIAGPNAADLLAKGCPLDLHPRAARPGFVAGSVLAKITALIHLPEPGIIDLHIGRSFADYLWAWLLESGADYGVTIE